MRNILCPLLFIVALSAPAVLPMQVAAQGSQPGTSPSAAVNVFLGSSGDHGQLSPGAVAPFGLLNIAPQTYPNGHTGYEFKARTFLGFTHTRIEGVGCTGSGGNIMITPFYGKADSCLLTKTSEKASPGNYQVSFANGIAAKFVVNGNLGLEQYSFPKDKRGGLRIDLSHTLSNKFVAEEHQADVNSISGWIDSRTTCNAGTYRVYYCLIFDNEVMIQPDGDHGFRVIKNADAKPGKPAQNQLPLQSEMQLRIALSSVDAEHARAAISTATWPGDMFAAAAWDMVLGKIKVSGDNDTRRLFYSMLYRTMQSPFLVSEKDGRYRAIDGSLQHGDTARYNGWAIWDNYRTQLPLLALADPERYQSIINSIADLYKHGKKDYATQHEPSNTVRTEHAIVVLLDAWRKGFAVDFNGIKDSLIAECGRLDFSHPDKALESSYDTWALSQILAITGDVEASRLYQTKAADWKRYWDKDFRDLQQPDIDKIGARGMYQGTVWQYRWLVPFDMKGLISLAGGEAAYLAQLSEFFGKDYYNHANETDIQAPLMYNFTQQPWQSQHLVRKFAADTVVQYYFNDNSRGIDPFVDRVYQNKPDTYIRTMDDDAGAMSAWYVLAACGLMPACVGWPVYYLNVPLLNQIRIGTGERSFVIETKNQKAGQLRDASPAPAPGVPKRYIQSATLNGKPLLRNWITHQEISSGGKLIIVAGDQPNTQWGITDQWMSHLD